MAGPAKHAYKRSWKNLLLNKRYQLQFTLFMVGMSALLMVGLGFWVMKVASSSNTVAANNLYGAMEVECKDPSEAAAEPTAEPAPPAGTTPPAGDAAPAGTTPPIGDAPAGAAPAAGDAAPAGSTPPIGDAPAGATPAPGDATPAGTTPVAGSPPPDSPDPESRPHAKPVVTIDETMMTPPVAAPTPAPAPVAKAPDAAAIAAYDACKQKYAADVAELGKQKNQIIYALIATGLLLMLGLSAYGIKMTHKVAGPLFKVSLYLDKLRNGTYDTVYNLRKGDQLVEFYDHFKLAHAGVKKMQTDDVAQLKAVLGAADEANLSARSPELAAAIAELRAILTEKEKSLV